MFQLRRTGDADVAASASVLCPRCRLDVWKPAVKIAAGWQMTSLALKAQFGILAVFLFAAVAILARFEPPPRDGSMYLCASVVLLLGYFLALCLLASAPDPTARRSALACVLTLVFGTIGLFLFGIVVGNPGPMRLSPDVFEPAIGFGGFTVYFSAFVFLMRFHATVARAFGNRRLRRRNCAYVFAPVLTAGLNMVSIWLTLAFRFGGPGRIPFGISRDQIVWMQIVFNFAVVAWYAASLRQTFRTIDRGPVNGESRRSPTGGGKGRNRGE